VKKNIEKKKKKIIIRKVNVYMRKGGQVFLLKTPLIVIFESLLHQKRNKSQK